MSQLDLFRPTLIVAALLLSAYGGWAAQGWRADARVQSLMAAQRERDAQAATLLAAAERANTARLQAAADAADAAVLEAQTRAAAATHQLESTRALLTAATRADRACLSADAVRLLNHPASSPAAGSGLRLPALAGGLAGPAATTPPDQSRPSAAASERAISGWIAQAQAMYATCSARIDAIAAWQQSVSQTHLLADSSPQK